jgi:hypothetical protein
MFENLEKLIESTRLELEGVNKLLEAYALQASCFPEESVKTASAFKQYMGKDQYSDVFMAQLHAAEVPEAKKAIETDIKTLKADTENDHSGVIHYLTRFMTLLGKLPRKSEGVMEFLHTIGVPYGEVATAQRVGFMLDHTLDEYSTSTEKHIPVLEASEGRGRVEYAQRVMNVVEFMTKEQHKFG